MPPDMYEPAFPFPTCGSDGACGQNAHGGMSLRDYFAAAVLQSVTLGVVVQSEGHLTDQAIATTAYRIADAMLAAR